MKARTIRRLDRLTLAGIAAGLALVLHPWWAAGFRAGFFVVMAAVLGQIATSHLLAEEDA
jgi:hypothetical protein